MAKVNTKALEIAFRKDVRVGKIVITYRLHGHDPSEKKIAGNIMVISRKITRFVVAKERAGQDLPKELNLKVTAIQANFASLLSTIGRNSVLSRQKYMLSSPEVSSKVALLNANAKELSAEFRKRTLPVPRKKKQTKKKARGRKR